MKKLSLLFLALPIVASTQTFPFELESDRRPILKTGGSVLIKNGKLLTVTKGTIEKGDLLIVNGKISKIGGSIDAPPGVQVVDAKGKVVAPGIVDGHIHRGADAINEGTDSITAEVRIEDVLNPSSRSVYHALAGGETSGMLLHGSANAIGGQSSVVKLKYGRNPEDMLVPDAPRMIKFALGENVTRSGQSSFGTNTTQRFPRTRMGQQAVYRRAFTDARQYLAAWEAWEASDKKGKAPRRDLRLETLGDILKRKVWVQCHSYRADEILMMVRLSQEFGFKIGAMQHALEAYKVAPELAAAGVSASMFVDNWSFKIEGYDAIPYNAWICTKAGVNVTINTDGTNGVPAIAIDGAKTMRYGGLSEEQALATLTINSAKALGIDHRVGSLEVGKDGDVVIWDGHPLSVYSRVNTTFVEGEAFFQRRDAHGIDSTSTLKTTLEPNKKTRPLEIPDDAKAYVIRGATLYPVSQPSYVGSIRIEGEKITEVGAKVNTSGAKVIDVKGLEVYPGFIDAGNSIGLAEVSPIGQMVDTTELGSFNPDLVASVSIQTQSEHFPVARMGGVLISLTRPSGGTISGQSSVIQNGGWTTEKMRLGVDMMTLNFAGGGGRFEGATCCDEISDLLNKNHEEDEDHDHHGELMGGGIPELIGIAQGSSELDKYIEKAKAYANDPKQFDLQLQAMIPYVTGKAPVLLRVRSASQIREAVAFAKKHDLKAVLSGAPDAWREAALLKSAQIPVLIEPAGKSTLGADTPTNDWDPYDTPRALPALLARKGVKFAFQGNDNSATFNLPVKVGQSCAYGLSRSDAIRALTLSAAEILGVSDKVGSLEAGKLASIVISDGDPFELTSNIVGVFVSGKPMPLESKFTRLRDQWSKRK